MMSKLRSPTKLVAAPSQMVSGVSMRVRSPVRKPRQASSPASGSTPTTLHLGASSAAARALPEMRPPPPVQTKR